MELHPEIIQHCWKHAGLDSASTAQLLVSQPPSTPAQVVSEAPLSPSLPDAVQRANDELRELMDSMAKNFQSHDETLDLHSYINVDADLDRLIHPSLSLPAITRAEHVQGLRWLQKFERYFPGDSRIQNTLHFMSSPEALHVLPPLKQKTIDCFFVAQ